MSPPLIGPPKFVLRPIIAQQSLVAPFSATQVTNMHRIQRLRTAVARVGQVRCKTVAVALSGGVDSSVAASVLKKQGHEVFGIYMRNWDPVDEQGDSACTADKDCEDARQVAKQLDIPFHEVSFVKEYWNHVFEPFLQGYTEGITPNPDVYCNRHIKFDALLSKAKQLGADALATGHYARLQHKPDGSLLRAAVDGNKDQSYFLCMTAGEHLRDAMFPLGEWMKPQVRQHAMREQIITAEKRESMGICFVGKRRRFNDFLSEYIDSTPGNFVTLEGQDLGPHQGFTAYTIGQGAKIGGATGRYFVADKDVASGNVIVVCGPDHPALFSKQAMVEAGRFSWVAGQPPSNLERKTFSCRIRHRHLAVPCKVRIEGDTLTVLFDDSQRAVSPGQILALYDEDICLGGGPIASRI